MNQPPIGSPESGPAEIQEASSQAFWSALHTKVAGFGTQRDALHEAGVQPPSQRTLADALHFLGTLRVADCPPDRVVPSAVGGMGFVFRRPGRKVYVEFDNKDNVLALFSEEDQMPTVTPVEKSSASYLDLIEKAKAYLEG